MGGGLHRQRDWCACGCDSACVIVTKDPLAALEAARERTLAAPSARIELLSDHTWEMPQMPRRRQGGLLRLVANLGRAAGKRLLKKALRGIDLRHQSAEGFLDLAQRRYMLDHGHYARLYAGGKEWDGRSGRALATLPADEHQVPTPLWLLDILSGVTSAAEDGTDDVRGVRCRHLTATIDLSRASAATRDGVAVPARGRFEDLLAVEAEVWIDDKHVRRIAFCSEQRTETLELWDFGIDVEDLDWTRLPTFRSPEEAAELADRLRSA